MLIALRVGEQQEPEPGAREQLRRSTSPTGTGRPGAEPAQLTELQRRIGNRAVGRMIELQRKEVPFAELGGKQDWTTFDRVFNTQRWKDACLANLNAVDTSQYRRVVERRDFYKWFYEHTAALGYTTRWPLAAYLVANGAAQIADMDREHAVANDVLGLANVQLQGIMRQGNQVIFDNVLPKLKRLLDGGPLTGRAALEWDMQTLAEEQTLIQPLYSGMSKQTLEQLDYIARKKRFAGWGAWWTDEDKVAKGSYHKAGTVPGFAESSLQSVADRWRYGMKLGDRFAPAPTGFDPKKDVLPSVSYGYHDGSELAKVNTQANLHQLDAWLNPHRLARGPKAGASLRSIVAGLTAFEKQLVLTDRSADGWAYSKQFAQFGLVDESLVRSALPTGSAQASAVKAFIDRYKAERARVMRKYPTPGIPVPF